TNAAPVRKISVDTPLYRAEFTSQGAVLTSFRLKKYTDDYGQPLEMVPAASNDRDQPLSLQLQDKGLTDLANRAAYTTDQESSTLSGTQTAQIVFAYSDSKIHVQKQFTFSADNYVLKCQIEASKGDEKIPVGVIWSPGVDSLANYKDPAAASPSKGLVYSGDKVQHLDSKSAEDLTKIGSTIHWAGVENNYFSIIMIPANEAADAYMNQVVKGDKKLIHNIHLIVSGVDPKPLEMSLFVGPKDYQLLKNMGSNLESAIDFGYFKPVTIPLYYTLRYFYGFTKNYGWAILLLTVAIKIIFTPFMQKSFKSMKKMQLMQPEMKKVQDKYAKMKNDDPRKLSMNSEIMALHKSYVVNPFYVCLPMLLQMPVLFAFYRLLAKTIDFRTAHFILLRHDVSRPDPYYVTPILMGLTMLVQQRMTPSTDPMQKNMMMMMPIMFTIMSFKFASGLVLYWLLSNALAILHQMYSQRQQQPPAAPTPQAPVPV